MGIFLGLATALSWGSADFIARFATRSTGSLRSVFWMQAWGGLFLTLFLFFTRDWGHLFDKSGWQPWAWGGLAGLLNTCAMLALYRAFEVGKMSVVAPVSASYPALTLLLSFFSGDRFSVYHALGIAAVLLGVLLVAGGESSAGNAQSVAVPPASKKSGIPWAIVAAVGFGFLFWLLGTRIIPRTGALATVWLIRITGTLLTLGVLLGQRMSPRLSGAKSAAQTTGMGLLDTGAFALSNLGMKLEQVAIISVLGSLYGAVTVALAALFLRERVATLQWVGIASIFLGIFLMNI
jgi:drug/metabolite transporter (DMT)-like permease